MFTEAHNNTTINACCLKVLKSIILILSIKGRAFYFSGSPLLSSINSSISSLLFPAKLAKYCQINNFNKWEIYQLLKQSKEAIHRLQCQVPTKMLQKLQLYRYQVSALWVFLWIQDTFKNDGSWNDLEPFQERSCIRLWP